MMQWQDKSKEMSAGDGICNGPPHDQGKKIFPVADPLPNYRYNETGLEVMKRLCFLTSLPLAGTAQREGGGTTIASYHISLLVVKPPLLNQALHLCSRN